MRQVPFIPLPFCSGISCFSNVMSLNSSRINIITSLLDFIGATCTSSHIGVSEIIYSVWLRHHVFCIAIQQHATNGEYEAKAASNAIAMFLYFIMVKILPPLFLPLSVWKIGKSI